MEDIVFDEGNDFLLEIEVGTPGGVVLAVSFDGLNVATDIPISTGNTVTDIAYIG